MALRMVDLFAGAGGLSLGLMAAGFESALAVEASEMAAETYFRNLVNRTADRSVWMEHQRLGLADQIRAGLAVAKTAQVLEVAESVKAIGSDIDLVAGGPPCQGFSLAGMRRPDDQRNRLPYEFLRFVELLQPKVVLIENVNGIGARFTRSGVLEPTSVLEQLRIALSGVGDEGYEVQVLHLNASHFGVPQNRPRFMIIGLRSGLAKDPRLSGSDRPWRSAEASAELHDPQLFDETLLGVIAPEPTGPVPSVLDAIGDLEGRDYGPGPLSDYATGCRSSELLHAAGIECRAPLHPLNHNERKHGPTVTRRFELHLLLKDLGLPADLFSSSRAAIRQKVGDIDPKKSKLRVAGIETPQQLVKEIADLHTEKHSQRPLDASKPSPTVMSLPDDFVHYRLARTLTVREMARLQSFPDAFEFFGKETTGAQRRKVEVPQYTQVGNAVPPLLAFAVGKRLASLIAR